MNKILMKLFVDRLKVFQKSTEIKCNLFRSMYETRLSSAVKEKLENVLSRMIENIPSNNSFNNITFNKVNGKNLSRLGYCSNTSGANQIRSYCNYSMYFRNNLSFLSLNNLILYNNLYTQFSIIHNSLSLKSFIQSAVKKTRYFHSEREDNHGNRRKRNDNYPMALRLWENIADSRNINARPGFIFTVMSYNVLAQDLLNEHPNLYSYHDQGALNWNIRWNNIFEEIKTFYPDILCLQEVQETHVHTYFDQLKSLGYKSIYKKRTGVRVDGCAVYYKSDNINLIEYTEVEYFQPPVPLLNRDNVGLVVKFSPKFHPTRHFIVATTHLLYNPRRDDVRMAQIQLLLAEIDRICFKYGSSQTFIPVIITGDLNTIPESDLYRLIINGKLRYEELSPRLLNTVSKEPALVTSTLGISDSCKHVNMLQKRLDNVTVGGSNKIPTVMVDNSKPKVNLSEEEELKREIKSLSKGTLSHDFAFKSVYNHGTPKAAEATTYQDDWITVDYIFYSTKKDEKRTEDKLKLLSRYRLPTSQELSGITIPNQSFGSDHLSLIAKFKLEF